MKDNIPRDRLDAFGRVIPECECPTCHKRLDACTQLAKQKEERGPAPGDVSVCTGCAEVLIFNDDMTPRLALLDDLLKVGGKGVAAIGKMQEAIRKHNREKTTAKKG